MYTWGILQEEVAVWKMKNFPLSPPRHQVWGCIEELGELVHSQLKMEQGIRGSTEKHIAAGKDAVADSIIFFMNVCTSYGWAAEDVLKHPLNRELAKTPENFQMEHGCSTADHSPIVRILTSLSSLASHLEAAEFEGLKKEAHLYDAQAYARRYVSGLAVLCTQMGWSMQEILEEVWPKVQQRDWTKNKVTGGDLDAVAAK